RYVCAFDKAAFAQAAAKRLLERWGRDLPSSGEITDHRHRSLLRPRRQRPRRRRGADEREEGAAGHGGPRRSITPSARTRNVSGIVRPIALAVVKLTTRSNRVGCSTGMSAGFVPRSILSTSSAERRKRSAWFGP